jgi:hypothetical protein
MTPAPKPNRGRWRDKFSSRKFILTCAIIAGVGVLLWFGKIGEASFTQIVIFVTGMYLGSNVSERLVEAKAQATVPVVSPPILPVKPIG